MNSPVPDIWGKLKSMGDKVTWHPLRDHCLDVALVLRTLLDLLVIAQRMNVCAGTHLLAQQKDRLAVIAFLHDVGKCNWGFQAKANPASRVTAGHVLEAAGLLRNPAPPPAWRNAITEMCGWFAHGEDDLVAALLASISHHGRPVSLNDLCAVPGDPARWWRPHDGIDPMQAVDDLALAAREAFPAAFRPSQPMAWPPAFQHQFAGLLMLADWIGSDTSYFPFRANAGEDRFELARVAAARAVAAIGLVASPWRSDLTARHPGFRDIFGFNPYPLQSHLAHALGIGDDSRIVLVESETGSGKTEAAIAWFLRLFSTGQVAGLYFALPTRVAARELYQRVLKIVGNAFPDPMQRPSPVLLAAPGYVRVDGVAQVLPATAGVLLPDHPADARHEDTWAAERPKRFLAAPIAVGTVDQALLSVLQVRHAHLRAACLDRHLLVVDEVHASDPYMREILSRLLQRHAARGGWSLLLSATLGEVGRAALLHEPCKPLTEAVDRPYPLVTSGFGQQAMPSASDAAKRVALGLHPSLEPDTLVPRLRRALEQGARVLVVMNTVARANALLRAVEADPATSRSTLFSVAGNICPHHGRFARADRELLDHALSVRLGPGSPSGPLLVVGTQTLEQSLDIDADWLVTDPCPMDVLLQRIGRLHRHRGRTRPSMFAQPRVLLLAPEDRTFVRFIDARGEGRGPAGVGRVYSDVRVLQATLDELACHPELVIPRDNRRLVEATTHPEALARFADETWARHVQYLEGQLLSQLRAAELGALEETPFGECQFRAPDERVTTRLGASDLCVELPGHPMSPFGVPLAELVVPQWLAGDNTADTAADVDPSPNGFVFRLGSRRFRYSRFGLEKHDA